MSDDQAHEPKREDPPEHSRLEGPQVQRIAIAFDPTTKGFEVTGPMEMPVLYLWMLLASAMSLGKEALYFGLQHTVAALAQLATAPVPAEKKSNIVVVPPGTAILDSLKKFGKH